VHSHRHGLTLKQSQLGFHDPEAEEAIQFWAFPQARWSLFTAVTRAVFPAGIALRPLQSSAWATRDLSQKRRRVEPAFPDFDETKLVVFHPMPARRVIDSTVEAEPCSLPFPPNRCDLKGVEFWRYTQAYKESGTGCIRSHRLFGEQSRKA